MQTQFVHPSPYHANKLDRKVPCYGKQFLLAGLVAFACFIVCNTPLYAQGPDYDWAVSMGGTGWDNGYAMTVDGDGNSYVTGLFRGTADFDPGAGTFNMSSVGSGNTLFVSKLDAAGNFVWAKSFGSAKFNYSYAITHDTANNIYITGYFYDTVDFDPGPDTYNLTSTGSATTSDVFVLKLDSAGNFVWAKNIGGASNDQAFSIVADSFGNVLIGGKFIGSVDFDPGPDTYTLNTDNADAFILKLNSDGQFVWAKDVGHGMSASASGIAYSLAVDGSGNVYTAGYFSDTVDFDPGTGVADLTSNNGISVLSDIFVSKLDASGNFLWAKSMGSQKADQGTAITLDGNDNVYLTCVYYNTVDFDPGPEVFNLTANNTTNSDIAILKLNTDGDFIWAKDINGATGSAFENNYAFSLQTDKTGYCYITGYFNGQADFDPNETSNNMYSSGASDVFILKLNPSGDFVWSKQIGGPDIDVTHSAVLDAAGNIYVTGWFKGTSDFDPGSENHSLTAIPGGADIFVVKLSCGDTSSTILTDTACDSFTLNGETYTESGTYTQLLPNAAGCDSFITLQLTISVPDPVITINGFELSTSEPYAVYQWYLNGTPIDGATNSTYIVSENGDYTVEVTNGHGCTAMSAAYTVTNVTGINDINGIGSQIKIYPNPARDLVYIESPLPVGATLTAIDGKVLHKESHVREMSLSGLAEGVYFLQLRDKNNHLLKVEKLVKQND